MVLLDPVNTPGGRELGTLRNVWRVKDEQGRVYWAYIETRGNQVKITGYAMQPVEEFKHNDASGALLGAGLGAAFGASIGGPPGAIVGGLFGFLLGASGPAKNK
ncbi:MAG: hypothetical protein IPO67_31270 [Deltaproteobacteria bacterium]|nr:hypothetical protein [Deltaproteobacteria bacterium]